MKSASASRSPLLLLAGGLLFAFGFEIDNRFQIVHRVLYRWVSNDPASAINSFLVLALQAVALLTAMLLLGRRWFALVMVLAFVSIVINLGYGETVNDTIDAGKLAWMAGESRLAGDAAGQFTAPLLFAGAQALAAIGLFVLARVLLRKSLGSRSIPFGTPLGLAVLIVPSLLVVHFGLLANASELNLYSLGIQVAAADPPPPREPVELVPNTAATPRHILWLVDESVAYAEFERVIAPKLAPYEPVDFGETASLANCSAQSNLALRSGVDVRHAGPQTDLRRMPSIWGYARKAGYRTELIDGQTNGPPQNIMLPPERALIDDLHGEAAWMDTDVKIADHLNAQLREPGRTFTYVVLRGVHFQYKDHYPAGLIPADSPKIIQYRTALAYSKGRFFDHLLAGVDRSGVAVVYQSDHGQNFAPGKLSHCSLERVPSEYQIPLLAFVPDAQRARYAAAPHQGHSASQVFPTLLEWMGYDATAAQRRYDNDLTGEPVGYVRFGRNAFPLDKGDKADVTFWPKFPGA